MLNVRSLVLAWRKTQMRSKRKAKAAKINAARKSQTLRPLENSCLLKRNTNPGHAEATNTIVRILGDCGNTATKVRAISIRVSE
jgi:hypothetical protein